GVAAKSPECIQLCEAFGFDVILVETVGVGQSELTVSQMVDFFLLLMQPGSGDDLQGIKRGILEVCQMVAVNKADGELLNKANIAKSEFEMALKILRSQDSYQPKVYTCSALKAQGLQPIWDEIKNYFATQDIIKRRSQQVQSWFDSLMIENINTELKNNKAYNDRRTQATKAISKHSNSVIDL